MAYSSLATCMLDLEKHGQLVRIKEEVDPYLEMPAIHLRVHENKGPALFFEHIKGCRFPAISNLFGTLERSRFIFRDTLNHVKALIDLKIDPLGIIKHPFKYLPAAPCALAAQPLKSKLHKPIAYNHCQISDLPQIVHWPMDGGPFITLPQVYTEDIDSPGIWHANLGMYRIQLGGNDYVQNKEIGLHYQLHRGIGVHQTKANAKNWPLKVSIFIGGPPAHTVAAVMPLPEGMSELTFAGALANRRFRYFYDEEGFCISSDADFVITGTVSPHQNKLEGPFGDHLGYYSLKHPFPLMHVHRVYHRRDAIWPFTVVGRPPQEDTSFGALIHELSGTAISHEIPGLHQIHAVDAAGVHPLLFAIGSERYTPYMKEQKPQELLTIANHILGKGQLSLAKYLFIAAKQDDPSLDVHNISAFLEHILERIDFNRDLHFHTQTTIDTLDYSGTDLNTGSKVVFAATGTPKRKLHTELPDQFTLPRPFHAFKLVIPGIIAIEAPSYQNSEETEKQITLLNESLREKNLEGIPLFVLCDDAAFTAASISNFVWVCFTRSNPSHDIHGINSFTKNKHWGCQGPLIIDARMKPHHAPPLVKDPLIERQIDRLGLRGASLYGFI
ncbi:MAG: UbiD family decarboxylase [Sphingobacteriaceae bacterium]